MQNPCDLCGTDIPTGCRYVAMDRMVERLHDRPGGGPQEAVPTRAAVPLLRACTGCAPNATTLRAALLPPGHPDR